ncbi:LysR family transcriptional regulator [Cribrihabitans pelagius]|uniref:LysR family transcriptional regulator n=1 Tax=Cribrihabitans pelagius TaxID=1765746 RepID=UPI003B5AEC89
MESRQLRYFAAIYEHGSLAQAAGHLNAAASALNHHLANLEAELGAQLFLRRPRGLSRRRLVQGFMTTPALSQGRRKPRAMSSGKNPRR